MISRMARVSGEQLVVECLAYGGWPVPSITWHLGKQVQGPGTVRELGSQGVREFGSQGVRGFGSQGVRDFRSQGVGESGSQGVRESGSQGVRESDKPKRSSEYSRVTLEIFQVRPIITESVRGDRRGVYHNDHARTDPHWYFLKLPTKGRSLKIRKFRAFEK